MCTVHVPAVAYGVAVWELSVFVVFASVFCGEVSLEVFEVGHVVVVVVVGECDCLDELLVLVESYCE